MLICKLARLSVLYDHVFDTRVGRAVIEVGETLALAPFEQVQPRIDQPFLFTRNVLPALLAQHVFKVPTELVKDWFLLLVALPSNVPSAMEPIRSNQFASALSRIGPKVRLSQDE